MDAPLQFQKTRIAPTPSGFLHLGNALSFLITATLAKRTGAKVLLRIDDMDRERASEEYVRDIFETLPFLGIGWDEGPADYTAYQAIYSQWHRMALYEEALEALRASGRLFACTCSRKQMGQNNPEGIYPGTCRDKALPLDTPGASWRLRTEGATGLRFRTLEGMMDGIALPPSMRDFIVRKKDGFPAYQLTSVADDLHFGVDLIVRGQDLWASTLAQLYLASVLQRPAFSAVTFYHHPLLEASPGTKLSKSAGATSIQYFRQQGKTVAAVYERLEAMAAPLLIEVRGLWGSPGSPL